MTNLFLYSLGFICLLIIGALFLDAYLAKRQIRQWFEWKQIDDSEDDFGAAGGATAGGIADSSKRRKKIIAGVVTVAVSILLIAILNKPANATSRLAVSNSDPLVQASNASDAMLNSEQPPIQLMRQSTGTTLVDEQTPPGLPNIPEWMLGVEWMPESELDFSVPFDLDADADFSGIEITCSANTSDLTDDISANRAMTPGYELDGTISLDSSLQRAIPSQVPIQ